MSEARWKRAERTIADRLHGQRVPVSGRGRGDAPDIRHPWLSIEVKTRKALPAWLKEAMSQAVAAAGVSQLPIAVLHEVGDRHADDIVCLRLADWLSWFGDLAARNTGGGAS